MVTSRSVPQQTAQIFSPLAGQYRAALRFSQIGQFKTIPLDFAETTDGDRNAAGYDGLAIKTKLRRLSPGARASSGHDDFVVKAACGDDQKKRPDSKKSETVEP